MGEVGEYLRSEIALLHCSDAKFKSQLSPLSIHIDKTTPQSSSQSDSSPFSQQQQDDQHPKDSWLPITESRNGNAYFAAFHILNTNIGFQALMLPVAFATLGWVWGSVCLTVAFVWQLYTIFLLVRLHESVPGTRHSRFLLLAMAAFGKRLGKVGALFPVMYLSGGTCVMLIITGGGTMKLLFNTLCDDTCHIHSLSGALWFLVFTFVAIVVAQLPNLNSMAVVSLVGAVTAITYCTLFWVLSVKEGRPKGVSYTPSVSQESDVAKISDILNAVGIIFLAFRGHNLLLEIQGTLPSNDGETSKEPMRRAVIISYVLIAMCVFPLAIAGFWAYGNQIQSEASLLTAFARFHKKEVTKFSMGAMYLLVITHCLSSYQVYAMPVFDNVEQRYTSIKNQKCPRWVRTCIRLVFGGFTFFIAVTFPFLPSLAGLLGGMTLVPLTYAYPCFMWLAIKKPQAKGVLWYFNAALGCLGMLLGVLLVGAAVWSLADRDGNGAGRGRILPSPPPPPLGAGRVRVRVLGKFRRG